jgi:hypothetical protein
MDVCVSNHDSDVPSSFYDHLHSEQPSQRIDSVINNHDRDAKTKTKLNSAAFFSPQANYTDRTTGADRAVASAYYSSF